MNTLIIPNKDGSTKREIARPWFLPSQSTLDEQKRVLGSVYFLVKQGDAFGERLKCTRCSGRHDYITLMCVERPISGLAGGLYAYYRAIADHRLENDLSAKSRARYEAVKAALADMPDLGTSHPQMARTLMSSVMPSDMQLGALSFGVLEGIAPIHAFKLVQKINDRGLRPKLKLEDVSVEERKRASMYRGEK